MIIFRIIFILFSYFLVLSNSYAYSWDNINSYTWTLKLSISTNKDSVKVWDNFNLNTLITYNDNDFLTWALELDWLENFEIISKNINKNIELVSNISFFTINTDFILKAKNKWEYLIWPLKIQYWTGFLESNTVKINIFWVNAIDSNINKNSNSKNDYKWIFYLPFFFLFLLYWFYNWSIKEIKKEEKIINNFNNVDDIFNFLWKQHIKDKLSNENIHEKFNELKFKINKIKYSKNNDNVSNADIKNLLIKIYYLLK